MQDEELTITMSKQSASTRAYTAAGGEQACASDKPLPADIPGRICTLQYAPADVSERMMVNFV